MHQVLSSLYYVLNILKFTQYKLSYQDLYLATNSTVWFIGFSLLGQNALVLGLIVLLFIPITVMLKVQEGVVTSCLYYYMFSMQQRLIYI